MKKKNLISAMIMLSITLIYSFSKVGQARKEIYGNTVRCCSGFFPSWRYA